MSRIYEALQKAESEKKAERQPGESPLPADEPRNTSATATLPYEEPATFGGVSVDDPAPVHDLGGGLNLSAVASLPWNPAIDRLPALLERGPAVEQFRSLRSRVYEARDIRPLKSILVSSGLPQEGKSFVSANLAVSLARHKSSKVLLIDGDMRRYTLHEMLGTESHPGLAEYLAGKASAEQVMQRMAEGAAPNSVNHILSNLTFIPGGNGGDKAADLSGNPRFGELLRLAAPYFDWIIVDSSPVVPVSDGVNLARSCDGVLLVARAGVTKYAVAQRAASELRSANVLGFVLNALVENPQTSSYYGYNSNKE
ncbi:CpsD/CapB family tyrosine-protein kinase [Edaphobacter sp. 12200R-103]|jgi:protein-tyrosine kinase|uniref:CpsD/CapB family tyrosine-protein kinase n=1 Tax=Edaphobacter sp. 12200R-103 TaxID=2703788 RepID=UPI00138BC854|nr:CpsD/CapB family tyrosine-protein kinase [Edaphobacter sp. 12200R-103]QHS52239.1 CpsD/CapB family tyrosine-protein kinase [Edaphobacter sp. 12200R-103]